MRQTINTKNYGGKKGIGDPSSKYGYDRDGKQFEADIQASIDRSQFLWSEFVAFMKSYDVDPREFRWMFGKYYEQFIKEGE